MIYRIVFQKAAVKFLKKQDKPTQERLLHAINALPNGIDIKKLQGYDMYRLRVGNMRVLYTVDNVIMVINIKNIDNRGNVYKRI